MMMCWERRVSASREGWLSRFQCALSLHFHQHALSVPYLNISGWWDCSLGTGNCSAEEEKSVFGANFYCFLFFKAFWDVCRGWKDEIGIGNFQGDFFRQQLDIWRRGGAYNAVRHLSILSPILNLMLMLILILIQWCQPLLWRQSELVNLTNTMLSVTFPFSRPFSSMSSRNLTTWWRICIQCSQVPPHPSEPFVLLPILLNVRLAPPWLAFKQASFWGGILWWCHCRDLRVLVLPVIWRRFWLPINFLVCQWA